MVAKWVIVLEYPLICCILEFFTEVVFHQVWLTYLDDLVRILALEMSLKRVLSLALYLVNKVGYRLIDSQFYEGLLGSVWVFFTDPLLESLLICRGIRSTSMPELSNALVLGCR